MTREEREFLEHVAAFTAKHPSISPFVAEHAQIGLKTALYEIKKERDDMEAIALASTAKRFPDLEGFVRQKISQYAGKLAFNWDWFLEPSVKRGKK